jgi:hypothetical protein
MPDKIFEIIKFGHKNESLKEVLIRYPTIYFIFLILNLLFHILNQHSLFYTLLVIIGPRGFYRIINKKVNSEKNIT